LFDPHLPGILQLASLSLAMIGDMRVGMDIQRWINDKNSKHVYLSLSILQREEFVPVHLVNSIAYI